MARISEIEKIRGRVRVLLDDGSEYLLLTSMFRERPLEVNQEIDPEEYAHWVTVRQYRSALDKAVAMLAARACSRGEIEQKLKRTGYAPETVEMVLYKLEKEGFLDDRAFADQWVRARAGRKYGPRRIAQELRNKGVSREETEEALSDLDEAELLQSATAFAQKTLSRSKPGEDPAKTRQRILGALVRRGYDWDLARQACAVVLSGDPDDEDL